MAYSMRSSVIQFYDTGAAHDIYSNVTDIGFAINLDGRLYTPRSSEAVYQGLKAIDKPAGQHLIADTRIPGGFLQKEGTVLQNPKFMTGVPFATGIDLKEQLMYEIQLAKFTQNPTILRALLNTAPSQIEENSPVDKYWGIALLPDGKKGYNALGKVLMRCRETLQAELTRTGQIQVREGISDALATALGHTHHQSNSQLTTRVITAQQLATTPAATTVDDFHRLRQPSSSHSSSSSSSSAAAGASSSSHYSASPLSAPSSSKSRVLTALSDLKTGAIDLIVAADPRKPGEHVIKVVFSSVMSAQQFAAKYAGSAAHQGGNFIIMGPVRAPTVFKLLGIETHGRMNPHPMFDALVFDHYQEQKRAPAPTPISLSSASGSSPTSPHSSSSSSSSSPVPSSSKDRVLAKLAVHGVTDLIVTQDPARPGQHVVKLFFSTPIAADQFAAKHAAGSGVPREGDRCLIMGSNRAPLVFESFGIGTHGRANHPMLEALLFDQNQALTQPASLSRTPTAFHRPAPAQYPVATLLGRGVITAVGVGLGAMNGPLAAVAGAVVFGLASERVVEAVRSCCK
ncbi:hypothetical protein BH10PSE19_BH10PSE19_19070 [soil metagenome]